MQKIAITIKGKKAHFKIAEPFILLGPGGTKREPSRAVRSILEANQRYGIVFTLDMAEQPTFSDEAAEVARLIRTITASVKWLVVIGNKWIGLRDELLKFVKKLDVKVAKEILNLPPAFFVQYQFLRSDDFFRKLTQAPHAWLRFEIGDICKPVDLVRFRAQVFDGRGLHAAMDNEVRSLFVNGQFQEAISRASIALSARLRKLSKSKLDGVDLAGAVLSEKTGVVRVNKGKHPSDTSEQRGIMFLAQGIASALRNPNAHDLLVHGDEYTLDALSTISLVHRHLDRN